jgi:hypothetical protein
MKNWRNFDDMYSNSYMFPLTCPRHAKGCENILRLHKDKSLDTVCGKLGRI